MRRTTWIFEIWKATLAIERIVTSPDTGEFCVTVTMAVELPTESYRSGDGICDNSAKKERNANAYCRKADGESGNVMENEYT